MFHIALQYGIYVEIIDTLWSKLCQKTIPKVEEHQSLFVNTV